MKNCFILYFVFLCLPSQLEAQFLETDTIVFSESFTSNKNRWSIGEDTHSKAELENGKLVHWFAKNGFQTGNFIDCKVNENELRLKFSLKNNLNVAGQKTKTFKETKKGQIKEKWITSPTWGFCWGFKDWNNYFLLELKNDAETDWTTYRIVRKQNGVLKTLTDWSYSAKLRPNDAKNNFVLGFSDNFLFLSINDHIGAKIVDVGTIWPGGKIGPIIGCGSEVELSDLLIKINKKHPVSKIDEFDLKIRLSEKKTNEIEGFYKGFLHDGSEEIVGVYEENGLFYLVQYGFSSSKWRTKDIRAVFQKQGQNPYKTQYFMGKSSSIESEITWNNNVLLINGFEKLPTSEIESLKIVTKYIKFSNPLSSELNENDKRKSDVTNRINSPSKTGTGFATSSFCHILTNYHVVGDVGKVSVRGIDGDFSKAIGAVRVRTDRENDLCILKLVNQETNLRIPYSVNSIPEDIGTSVFVLGYPMISSMGESIKLTNGIISSQTGFQDDLSSYQISAPIQPGNSGGPLFNSKGELIGVVNAKHGLAENASYAIKSSYLINLISLESQINLLQNRNSLSGLSLVDQVKKIKEFVYVIEVD